MRTYELTTTALLTAVLYIVYTMGSFVMYVELFNFMLVVYGLYFKIKQAWTATVLFTLLLIITRGLAPWTLMYLLLFPQYVLIYAWIKKKTSSEIVFAIVGGMLAFCCGTIIDLPYILIANLGYEALLARLLLGFQVSLGNLLCTFLAVLFLLKPLGKALARIAPHTVDR